jgi:hypothetical protein
MQPDPPLDRGFAPPPPPPYTPPGYPPPPPFAAAAYPAPPGYRLYSVNAVALATFLGSPLAGAVVMAINYARLGRGGSARMAVVLGLIGTAAVFAIAFVLPDKVPNVVIWLPQLLGMQAIAKALQGPAIEDHARRDGRAASNWKAAGIGMLGLLLFGGILLGVYFYESAAMGEKINVTKVEEIYYSKRATRDDAVKLGELLKSMDFFDGKGAKTVLIGRTEDGGTRVSFVVGNWTDPSLLKFFKKVGEDVAAAGFPKPVRVILCDDGLSEKHEIKVE